ncbi:uncharacterized protein LOC115975786 [Quercus lobata]|uniref:uncharacterized protein LOC115975786 n=1 Tax=Quercus lobata TaxID=97700 RepID=UPI0012458453|nr:uncharacterized protein LOC115975786 [Quercus lobata]
MYDLEKRLQEFEQKRLESEHKRIEAEAELKEEKHLKSIVEQQAIQMAEQRRHFEEQQASQMAEQRAHYDNMMMQMLSYITSQSAQSSSDHLDKEVLLLHTKVDLVVTLGVDGTALWNEWIQMI